jgi:hypothetical protein
MNIEQKAPKEPEDSALSLVFSRYFDATPLSIDLSALQFHSVRQREMAEAISAATERTRALLREDKLWGVCVPVPPRGFIPKGRRVSQVHVADRLPWPSLLALGSCADEAARMANCSSRSDVLRYAMSICSVDQIVPLMNLLVVEAGTRQVARALSQVILPLKGMEERMRRGAKIGGKNSASNRRKDSKTPPEKLREERDKLIEQGKDKRDIAGILAVRYGVTTSTIRKKLKLR